MGVYIRDKVDITRDVDLSSLTPIQHISVAIRYKWYNSSYATRQRAKKERLRLKAEAEREDNLREIILQRLRRNLVDNKNPEVKARQTKARALYLSIHRSYEDIIDKVLDSRDLASFNIERVKENEDLIKSNSKFPMIYKFKEKVL